MTNPLIKNILIFFFYQILERSHLPAFNRIVLTSCKGQRNNLAVFQTMHIVHQESNFISYHNNILLLLKKKKKSLPDDYFPNSNITMSSEMPPFLYSYCKVVFVFAVHCYLEILSVSVKKLRNTGNCHLGGALWKREQRVLICLPAFVQLTQWSLLLLLMSMHEDAASSSAQSPSCSADLYICVVFVLLYVMTTCCSRTHFFSSNLQWSTWFLCSSVFAKPFP